MCLQNKRLLRIIKLCGWKRANKTERKYLIGKWLFYLRKQAVFVSSCVHSLKKNTQSSRNTYRADINVITKYLGETKLGWFTGVPFLQGKQYHKTSVLPTLECEHITDSIPQFPNQEFQSFQPCTIPVRGNRWQPGLHLEKQGTPHEKRLLFPHKKRSFVCS